MSQQKKFISGHTRALFTTHHNKLAAFDYKASELPESAPLECSYQLRYQLKQQDESKQRFCCDVELSKEYEHWLRDYAHLIKTNLDLYFEYTDKIQQREPVKAGTSKKKTKAKSH